MNKKIVIACLLLELVLAYGISMGGRLHRRDEIKAWGAWHQDSTAENSAELTRQIRITEIHELIISGVFFAAMAVPTLITLKFISKKQTTKQV